MMTRPRAAKTAAPKPKLWYSVPEAAERLGIHRDTAYTLIYENRFPVAVYRIGTAIRIKVADLDAFLDERHAN